MMLTTHHSHPLKSDARYLWHPWSPTRVTPETLVAVRGEGCEVVDIDGVRYLDAKSSGLNATLGYGCEPVIEAATTQLRTLMTYDLGEGASLPSAALAERIARLVGPSLTRTFFCNSGSEAIEAALRMARFHFVAADRPERHLVVSLDRSYHGATMAAAAATGAGAERDTRVTPPGFVQVPTPRGDEASLDHALACIRALFASRGAEIAAVVTEPISSRTALPLSAAYQREVRGLCTRYGALLIADEVTTGFGRSGAMLAGDASGVQPDLLCTSKGLGAGYASIGAVTTTDEVFNAFEQSKTRARFVHGHTHSGHATACATAFAVLDYLEAEDVLTNVQRRHAQVAEGLADVIRADGVTSVHGRGLLLGIEVDNPARAIAARQHLLDERILVRRTGRTVLLAPPLIIDEQQTTRLVDATLRAFRASGRATRVVQ